MKWTTIELRKEFGAKVQSLSRLLKLAEAEEIESEGRVETLSSVAVVLRSLFCKDRHGIPLVVSSGFDKTMLFPLRNSLEAYNIHKESLLVGVSIRDNKCSFICNEYPFSVTRVPSAYLSYNNWINEVVIDFKREGFPPLSRAQVIKLFADRRGAHFDIEIDPYTALLKSEGIASMGILIDGVEGNAECANLISETVMSIAQEVVFAYNYLREPILYDAGESECILNVFDYSEQENNRFKFSVCSPIIHNYNTNDAYECRISQHPLRQSSLLFRRRFFDVHVVNINLQSITE